jgi:transposase-like protein
VVKKLDGELQAFAERELSEAFPYLDARYERVREAGVITAQAVLIAVAVDREGRRPALALKARGLYGVEVVVSDIIRAEEGEPGDPVPGCLAALLCALPAQCARLHATQGR